jgi:hypothetical protein
MQIEDSYEGAARRLAKLSTAGIDLLPSRRDDEEAGLRERMRDLEELAALATEENERLERELASARETIQRLQEQLTAADRQRLRDLVEAPRPPKQRRPLLRYLAALALIGLVVPAVITLRPWQYARESAQKLARRYVVHPWAVPIDSPAVSRTAAPVAQAPAVVPAPPVVVAAVVEEPSAAPEDRAAKRRSKHHHHAKAQKHHAVAAKPASNAADSLLGL